MPQPSSERSLALLQSMTMVSTLSTVADLWTARVHRQLGHDPSEQEDDGVAIGALKGDLQDVRRHLSQLRATVVLLSRTAHPDSAAEEEAHSVRQFDVLLTLNRLATRWHRIHQRLLSLYPNVEPDLVESVRALYSDLARLQQHGGLLNEYVALCETVGNLVHRLENRY